VSGMYRVGGGHHRVIQAPARGPPAPGSDSPAALPVDPAALRLLHREADVRLRRLVAEVSPQNASKLSLLWIGLRPRNGPAFRTRRNPNFISIFPWFGDIVFLTMKYQNLFQIGMSQPSTPDMIRHRQFLSPPSSVPAPTPFPSLQAEALRQRDRRPHLTTEDVRMAGSLLGDLPTPGRRAPSSGGPVVGRSVGRFVYRSSVSVGRGVPLVVGLSAGRLFCRWIDVFFPGHRSFGRSVRASVGFSIFFEGREQLCVSPGFTRLCLSVFPIVAHCRVSGIFVSSNQWNS